MISGRLKHGSVLKAPILYLFIMAGKNLVITSNADWVGKGESGVIHQRRPASFEI